MAKIIYITFGVALAYVLTAQLGFLLSLLPFWEVTLLWPPSGIALAALLVLGRGVLPGIFLGALVTNLISVPGTLSPVALVAVSTAIATTSTLSPLAASVAMRRIISSGVRGATPAQLLATSFTNFLACFIAAAGGILTLYLAGVVPAEILLTGGGMWWLGDYCGMMIFGPISWLVVRSLMPSRRRPARDPISTALLVNSAFVGMALVVFMALWSLETEKISRLLTQESTLAANNVTQVLQEAERDIATLRALAYASGGFDADEFRRYTTSESRVRRNLVAQGVGWAPRVTDPGAWEEEVQVDTSAEVRLYERDDAGQRVPVTPREAYFPVQYIQPVMGNEAAIGFDLASEPTRGAALERARDSGLVSMVSPITLVQSVDAEPAMLIGVPIYRPDVSLDTVAARRNNLTGFATAVYLIRPLFIAGLTGNNVDVEFHLFEQLPGGEFQWYHTSAPPNPTNDSDTKPIPTLTNLQAGPSALTSINFADHNWLVVATPGSRLISVQRTWAPWAAMLAILALGIVSSSILLERISARRSVQIERRKTEEALLEAREANDSMSFFMSTAGHDIKQPLYALSILTDTLLMSDPKASSVTLLERLRKSIDEMGEHFDALMNAGKKKGGKIEAELVKVRLAGIVTPIDAEIALLCADKGLKWHVDQENVLVLTDPLLLQRLLRNLLSNAVRYTGSGEVCFSAVARYDFVEFRISDTGTGIAPQYQQRVLDEFAQGDIQTPESYGTGLGLFIVATINQALDLGMQVESTPGGGTTFRFRVPLASEHA